jgi:hypothetical protein
MFLPASVSKWKLRPTKMKAMLTMIGSKVYASISKVAYTQRVTGEGRTHWECNLQSLQCELCGGMICQQHVANHQKTRKCERGLEEWTTNRAQMRAASTNTVTPEQHELGTESETREYIFNAHAKRPGSATSCQWMSIQD